MGWDAVVERARGEVRDGLSLADLVEAASASEREGLERLSLVVLRPDCLAAGRGAAVLERLAATGTRPLALRVTDLQPALIDAAYRRQGKIPRDRVWIHTASLTAGPAAALLVAGEPGLTERLYASKGATSTLQEPPADSLRRMFGRASATNAVVHIPEDLPAFVAEATLFFPWAALTEPPDAIPAGITADLVTLEPRPERIVFQAVVAVKRRIAAALALRLRSDAAQALLEATRTVDGELEGLGFPEQREALLAWAEGERMLLERAIADAEMHVGPPAGPTRAAAWRDLRSRGGAAELANASWFLTGHEAYGGDGGERLFDALAAHDVPLTPPQRTVLAGALANDMHPGIRFDGERAWPLGPDPGGASG